MAVGSFTSEYTAGIKLQLDSGNSYTKTFANIGQYKYDNASILTGLADDYQKIVAGTANTLIKTQKQSAPIT